MQKLFTILFSVVFSLSIVAQETNFIEEKGDFSKAASCPAEALFSNAGASGGWALTSSTNQGTVNYFKFDGDMLPSGAVIEGFHTWGLMAFHDGVGWAQCAADNMDFLVTFYANDNGEPGDLINEQTVTANAITTTDIAFGTWTVKRMEIALTTPIAFSEGFISIASTNAETCWFLTISAQDGEQNVYWYQEGEFVQRMITPDGQPPFAASVLLCIAGSVSEVVSATINPTEVTVSMGETGIPITITWNDATEVTGVSLSFVDFPGMGNDLDEDEYTVVDHGDGTASLYLFPDDDPKFPIDEAKNYNMVIHFTIEFDVGDDAILVVNVEDWKWWADIEVLNSETNEWVPFPSVYVHELEETFIGTQYGFVKIHGLDVQEYTLTISASGYQTMHNQTINVQASFDDNEFVYHLDPSFNTYFHFGVVDGTRPDWFSDNDHTERGLTADDDNVYVVSRKGAPQVLVLDRITGLETGTLNVNGVSGGFWALNDIEISADGHLVGFNMFLNGGDFKAYLLDETNDPEVLFTTNIEAGRYGDKVTLVGSFDDGSAVIYAANGSAPEVLKWTMVQSDDKDGWEFNPNPQVISLADVPPGAAGTPAVAPLPNGSFYWTANGRNVTKHNADGTLIGTISGGILATGTNAMKYLGRMGNDEILAVFAYGLNNEIAKVVRVLNGNPETTTLLFNTPTLRGEASTANPNGTGDVAFVPYPDGNAAIYVLGTNIGIGGYASLDLDLVFPVYPPADLVSATINPTEQTIDMNTGGVITTVITWNDASELTKVLITFPDFPDLPAQEITDDAYSLEDHGDGTATFTFDTNQPKGLFDLAGKYAMNALMTFIFDVGDNAILTLTINNWTWWAEIHVKDKQTGNPINGAMILIQELDETHNTNQWGWADIDLDAGTYTLNIAATGYVSLLNQVIVVEANFENEFIFELEPEGTGVIEPNFEGVAIFPNPATTVINVNSENPIIEISLTSMLGQVVYKSTQVGNSHSINITSFNKGVYFVRVATENEVLMQKVVIRK